MLSSALHPRLTLPLPSTEPTITMAGPPSITGRRSARPSAFRPATTGDADELAAWLLEEVAPYEYDAERLMEAAYTRLRALKIEPPTPGRLNRLVRSSLRSYDEHFCETTLDRLSESSIVEMDALLSEPDVPEDAAGDGADDVSSYRKQPTLARLRNDPGRASAESVPRRDR